MWSLYTFYLDLERESENLFLNDLQTVLSEMLFLAPLYIYLT